MRLKHIFWGVLLVLLAGCSGCPTDKVELKLKFNQGDSFDIKYSIVQKISQTIQGSAQDMVQDMGVQYSFGIEDVDSDGNALIKVTYHTVSLNQEGPMGKVEYDSSNPPAEVSPGAIGVSTLVGQTFSMRLSPKGKVKEMLGVDEMIDAMVEKLAIEEGPVKALVGKNLRQQFGGQALKEAMENMFAIYPDGPVAIGNSWSRQISMVTGFPANMDISWTLKSRKNNIAKLEVKATIKSDSGAGPINAGLMKIRYDVSGTQEGTLELLEDTGWIIGGEFTQALSGQVMMESTPDMPDGISWPVSLESKVSFEALGQ